MIIFGSMRRVGHGNGVQIHGGTNGIALTHFVLGMPAPRDDVKDQPRSHGTYDFTQFFSSRIIDMEGVIWAPDYNLDTLVDKWDAVKQEFSLYGAQKRFTFQRLGRTYKEFCDVRLGSWEDDLSVPGNMLTFHATLVASDPRIYRVMSPDDPRTQTFTSQRLIDNTGKGIGSPPVTRIYGGRAGSGIRNATLGTENSWRLARAVTGECEVNHKKREVRVNGVVDNSAVIMDSWYWNLVPGNNQIQRIGHSSWCEIDWREARI